MTADRLQLAQSIAKRPYFVQSNLKRSKAFSTGYLRYRVFRPLLKVYFRLHRLSYQPSPWIAPAAAAVLDKLLSPDMVGFEWGSGSSTIFFASRLQHLTSLEHHQAWYRKVEKWLQEKKITNVNYVPIEIRYPQGPEADDHYQKALRDDQIKAYEEYYSYIDRYPDEHFDFIMIDGRARVQCGLHAIPKLKKGGILVLDNAERARYKPLHTRLKDWPQVYTTTGLTDTLIWFKP